MDAIWTPIKEAGNLTDRIVARIEELITSNQLSEGERLPAERDMARMLGVSRPALREAVKTLEAHGRLFVRHGQGVFVRQDAPSAMRSRLANLELTLSELFAMREVLEVAAAGWAAESTAESEIGELEDILHAMDAARVEPIDFRHVGRLDAEFHLRIVEMARNRFLSQMVGVLQEMLAEGMETTLAVPGRLGQSRHDHDTLIDALRRHDAEAAREAARHHIAGSRRAALERVRAGSEELPSEDRTEPRAPRWRAAGGAGPEADGAAKAPSRATSSTQG
ncbi:MAG: FCD domain-containing protein [Actinomycetota bacterium]|nr:FCD domain-containing protein [Actinomycetota bacterium]